MKKINLVFAMAGIAISSIAMAQDSEMDNREKVKFGLKAGTNYSNVYNSKTEEFKSESKFGFVGGLFVSIPIGKYIGVQPEILYAQKGFKGEGVLLGGKYNVTRTTTFIDIPLQVAVKPSEFITILAGPQYSYLISRKDVFASTLVSYTQEQEFKNDDIRKNLLGFVAGVDINLKNVVLGGRVGWDITANNGDGTSTTPRYKNAWVQGTVGYTF